MHTKISFQEMISLGMDVKKGNLMGSNLTNLSPTYTVVFHSDIYCCRILGKMHLRDDLAMEFFFFFLLKTLISVNCLLTNAKIK